MVVSGGDEVVLASFPYNQRLSQDLTPRGKSQCLNEIKKSCLYGNDQNLPNRPNLKNLKNTCSFYRTVSSFSMGS